MTERNVEIGNYTEHNNCSDNINSDYGDDY